MFNSEELQFMAPKMSIEYRVEEGFLTSGNFDEIPANAFGALISTRFPVVGANGEFKFAWDKFNLFVGESYSVNDVLEYANNPTNNSEGEKVLIANETALKKIKEYKEQGYQKVANTRMGVVPLGYNDDVFTSHEEMAKAIAKINQTFKSIDFSIQNSQDEIDKSSHMHR